MDKKQTICLLNDSFPPQIDGVANAVINYAEQIEACGERAMVVTPSHPLAKDENLSYEVVRYPSVEFKLAEAYRAGFPFSPKVAEAAKRNNVSVLHSHCPIISTFMARELRQAVRAPIILTYHTKFDIDIDNLVRSEPLRDACKRALVENIAACDEVWAVSNGAGENMRALGYEGNYIVMPNGVDFPRGRVSEKCVVSVTGEYDLPDSVPIFLFVGRLLWYKGIRIILDAIAKLSRQNKDFRMIFIGDGADRSEMETYAKSLGIESKCIFIGAVHDREILRAWYCRADLFLFPSTYDTNGLVVREAAACSLGSVLIRGSCAAEGVFDGRNGFLIDESSDSLHECLNNLYSNREKMRSVGERASEELYISWESSVKTAMERYKYVINSYNSGFYPKKRSVTEGIFKINGEIMNTLARISSKTKLDK